MRNKKLSYYLVNSDCSVGCKSCYLQSQRGFSDRNLNQAKKDLDILSQSYDVRITGSDVLQYQGFDYLLKFCNQDYLLGNFRTIHSLSSALELAKKSGIKRIYLTSPYSAHFTSSGDTFKSAVSFVKEHDLFPAITYVLGKSNITQAEEMVQESLDLGVPGMRFMQYLSSSNENIENILTNNQIVDLHNKILSYRKNIPKEIMRIYMHGHFGTWFRPEKGHVCFAGEKVFIIGLDNKVYPCEFLMRKSDALGSFVDSKIHLDGTLSHLPRDICRLKKILDLN